MEHATFTIVYNNMCTLWLIAKDIIITLACFYIIWYLSCLNVFAFLYIFALKQFIKSFWKSLGTISFYYIYHIIHSDHWYDWYMSMGFMSKLSTLCWCTMTAIISRWTWFIVVVGFFIIILYNSICNFNWMLYISLQQIKSEVECKKYN